MIIVTWNLGRRDRVEQLDLIERLGADVVALQEVSAGRIPSIAQELARIGLPHVSWSDPNTRTYPFAQVIGARWPVKRRQSRDLDLPFPERVQIVEVAWPAGRVEVLNVHVPATTSSGVEAKVGTFRGLAGYLSEASSIPRVVCGDFNTPKAEAGTVVTYWGNRGRRQAEQAVIEPAGRVLRGSRPLPGRFPATREYGCHWRTP